MALSIGPALRAIKAQLDHQLPATTILETAKRLGHRWRKRLLDPAMTVHLCLLQVLAAVSLAGLRRVAKIAVTTQALCAAKMRLPLKVLMALVELANGSEDPASDLWLSHRLRLVDGSSFLAHDTPELSKAYGKASNQRGQSPGYPMPKLLAALDWATGAIRKIIALPQACNEFTCLSRLFSYLCPTDLVLGDRGLVSFAHIALMLRQALECCMRLSRKMIVRGSGRPAARRHQRLGRQDWLVRWTKPQSRPTWMSRKRWEALPSALILRQIAFRLQRPGFRTQWAWIITTLTDPQRYPAQKLAELYGRRWQVEVYFRDMKKTLKMEHFRAKTVEGVRKEILAFVLLYNLVRRVMSQAAAAQGVTADRISFRDALSWLLWSEPGEPLPELVVNPHRRRATEPRQIKRGRKRHTQLKLPRVHARKPAATAVI
jgi:hypothetical protein